MFKYVIDSLVWSFLIILCRWVVMDNGMLSNLIVIDKVDIIDFK